MRRYIACILLISILILLSGCKEAIAPETAPVTTEPCEQTTSIPETTEATLPAQVDTQLPLSTIALPVIEESTTADDGHIVFRYIHQNIALILPEPEVADRIILDYLNALDNVSAHAEAAAEAALQAYAADSGTDAHLLQVLYSPARLDGSILSLFGEQVSYNGGPHAVSSGQALNYDLLTGSRLLLPDILENGVDKNTVLQLLENNLSASAGQLLFSEYAALLKDLIPTDLSECSNWYFSGEGLVFFFAPGEIGPNSSGTVSAAIPYESLIGILKNAYFPAEIMPGSGTVSAQLFSAENLSKFESFSELILQEGSTKLLLSTDTPVYNLKIEEVSTFNITDGDFSAITLFAAHALSPKDAILLEADLSSSKLILSYRQANGSQVYAIAAENGTVILNKLTA